MLRSFKITKPIYLIGFMGSGKSFFSQKLGQQLGLPSYDLDEEITNTTQQSIAAYFAQYGEEAFRKIEQNILHCSKEKPLGIWATGGGTPCFFDNMEWINKNGLSVYLNVSIPILVKRLKKEMAKRPLIANLKEQELIQYIETKISARNLYYTKADICLEINDSTIDYSAILSEKIKVFCRDNKSFPK